MKFLFSVFILIFSLTVSAYAAPFRVVTTTGMIADSVKQVAGDAVLVTSLMGPGVDPHLYKATQGDVKLLSEAGIVFYNGLHLEGKMGEVLEKLARSRPVVAVAKSIDEKLLRSPPEFEGLHDPHIWFDPMLWAKTVEVIEQELSKILPEQASKFKSNSETYRNELKRLDAWCRSEIQTIPKAQRVLITAHDAFGYYGRTFDLEVLGLQGISTASEYGLHDLTKLIDTIVARKIKAVFVETSVSSRSIEALQQGVQARGHTVAIGGELFSDAMGSAETPEGTYVGMVKHNTDTIVKALR